MRYVLQLFLFLTLAVPAGAQECKYGFAYGHVYDLDTGEEVEVDPENLAYRLLDVSTCLQSFLPTGDRFLFPDSEGHAQLPLLSRFSSSFRNMPEEVWINDQVDVARALVEQAGIPGEQIKSIVADEGFLFGRQDDLHPHLVEPYIANCRAAGVPVPGPIGGDDWSARIDISGETTLLFSNETEMSIWLHGIAENGASTSDGFCVAFERVLSGDTPIGTICMNELRTQACFFDNLKYEDGGEQKVRMLPEETLQSEFREMAHVADSGNCSSCHVGDNPLLLHPGTTLHRIFGTGKTKEADFDFVAFGEDNWCNPDVVASTDGCSRCHDIALSSRPVRDNYCSVLKLSVNATMPPSRRSEHSHISLWPDENGDFADYAEDFEDYFSSLRELGEMCRSSGGLTGTCSDE